MEKIVENEPYTFTCNGEDFAKVLFYYGLIPNVDTLEYKIVCPFHEDVNPSMIVDLDKGSFYCFGCGLSGDAIRFIELVEKDLNTLQVIVKYLKILKSDKVEKIRISGRRKKRKQNSELYDIAHDYFYGLSTIDWVKGKEKEIIDCRDYMMQRGFSPETLNMINAKITYNKHYPIIFPMLDNGEFRGWVCRTNNKEVEKKRKYLYNEGFSRATTLVGDYNKFDYVFIVEGYMDRLKFIQNGVYNVVAILGWKITAEQIEKLKKVGIKHVVSALDNDKCGRKGTEYLKTIFEVTRFSYLKGIKDPGEMNPVLFKKMYKRTLKKLAQDRKI